jgi:hypothetical protein
VASFRLRNLKMHSNDQVVSNYEVRVEQLEVAVGIMKFLVVNDKFTRFMDKLNPKID